LSFGRRIGRSKTSQPIQSHQKALTETFCKWKRNTLLQRT
jgi:hypothetical protein